MIEINEQNGIISLFLGDRSKKINVLDENTLSSLGSYIENMIKEATYPRALLIRSVNEGGESAAFLAGADVNLIQSIQSPDEAYHKATTGQAIFNNIDKLPCPVFAFVDGVCLGGGLELALACDYIIASDRESTKLGLPEVSLGIIPGFGGTQRLPHRVGYIKGIELITNGKRLSAKEAKKAGLVDIVAPAGNFSHYASLMVEDILEGRHTVSKRKKNLSDTLVTLPGSKNIIDDRIRKTILSKTKGHYKAPVKAFEVISATYPACNDYEAEAKGFAVLAAEPEAKNLIRVFQISKSVSRYPEGEGVEYTLPPQIGIIGTGAMGNGIIAAIIKKGIETRVKAIDWQNANLSFEKVSELVSHRVKKASVKHNVETIDHLSYTIDYSGFKNIDFVIEAVFEDLPLKQQIVKDLTELNPDVIFASNTSSISISDIGAANPENTIGLHFFNPATKMPLVEVICTPQTSPRTIKTTMELAKKLGKTPILMQNKPGFVVNRILMPYLNEAVKIMGEGISQELIDEVLVEFGMPMGPVELIDQVGIDIAYHVGNILHDAYGARMTPSTLLRYMYDNKKLGKKTKEGMYIYPSTGMKMPNSYVIEKGLAISSRVMNPPVEHRMSDEELAKTEVMIIHRATFVMINEAARILEDQVVDHPAKIDMAMIMGTGFPPFRGGLLKYADDIGINFIVAKLSELSTSPDDIYAPAPLLLRMQAEGKKFFEG